MFRRVALLIVLVTAAAAGRAGDAPDSKDEAQAIKGWGQVVDPDKDCQIQGDPGRLTIVVPGTPHDFAAELQRWNAPRVMTKVKGEFIVQVRVSGELDPGNHSTADRRRAYQGAGLLIIGDDQNHVSLQKGALLNRDGVRRYANFEARKDGQAGPARNGQELEIHPTWLRLERHGPRVDALFSDDGVRWKAYEPIDLDLPDEVSVGVEAVSSSAQQFMPEFDNFAIFQRIPAGGAAKDGVKPDAEQNAKQDAEK